MIFAYIAISFLVTVFFLRWHISILSKTKFFKRNTEFASDKKACVAELHAAKSKTATMGGMAIMTAIVVFAIQYFIETGSWPIGVIVLLAFGLIGFADDLIKIKSPRDGVTSAQKLVLLFIVSTLTVALLVYTGDISSNILIPFNHATIHPNIFLFSACVVFLTALSANAVNITDGVDALALTICMIIFIFISICAYRADDKDVLFGAVVMGASCCGALIFNRYPAKVFIGDTGSLLLGAAIALFLSRLGLMFWIIPVMAVCLFEVASVIIQVFSLRVFKKKVFLIAPVHHHLEKVGFSEQSITITAGAITSIICISLLF